MTKILLTSHGDLCKGMAQSLEMLIGENSNLVVVSFENGEGIEEFEEKIAPYFNDLTATNQVLVCCDIVGGTPFNVASKFSFKNDNIKVIYGINLPVLVEAVMHAEIQSVSELSEYLQGLFQDSIGLSQI